MQPFLEEEDSQLLLRMVLLNARQDSPWTAGWKPVCTQQWAGGTQALESLSILDAGRGGGGGGDTPEKGFALASW